MSETLYGLFVALALLAAYRVLDRPEPISALLLGAAVALAALTRGEALLLVPLLVLPVCLWSGPGRLGRLAVAVLATVVLLAPWAVRNWVTFDRPVLISTNESTLTAGANCASVYGGTDVGFWHLQCISKRRPGLNEAEQASVWRARAPATRRTTWAAWCSPSCPPGYCGPGTCSIRVRRRGAPRDGRAR